MIGNLSFEVRAAGSLRSSNRARQIGPAMANSIRKIRIFLAAPRDVADERQRVLDVVHRLNRRLGEAAQLEVLSWEASFYRHHADFQAPIPEARECDVVVGVLWSRMGSPLPAEFSLQLPNQPNLASVRFDSSTEYELVSSLLEADRRNTPKVFIFRKTSTKLPPSDPIETTSEEGSQKRMVDAFFTKWFDDQDGPRYSHACFSSIDEFANAFEQNVWTWLEKELQIAERVRTKIFISYRRTDTRHMAGRIWDRLSSEYGADNIFFDADSIPAAVDFRHHIKDAMEKSYVVLMLIGDRWQKKGWLHLMQSAVGGASRVDYVHLELKLALDMAVPIIPICIDGAPVPAPGSLPIELRSIPFLQATAVRSGRDFKGDMDEVASAIDRLKG